MHSSCEVGTTQPLSLHVWCLSNLLIMPTSKCCWCCHVTFRRLRQNNSAFFSHAILFFLQIIKSIKTLLAYLNINFLKWHKTEVAYLLCVSKDERLLCLPWEHHLEQAQRCWQWCWCLFLFGPECCTRTRGCCHSSLDSWGTKELPHCWRLLNRTQLQTKTPNNRHNQLHSNMTCLNILGIHSRKLIDTIKLVH